MMIAIQKCLQNPWPMVPGLLDCSTGTTQSKKNIRISWKEIGKEGKIKVRYLWVHHDLDEFPE